MNNKSRIARCDICNARPLLWASPSPPFAQHPHKMRYPHPIDSKAIPLLFLESLSKGIQQESGFDELSPNGYRNFIVPIQ